VMKEVDELQLLASLKRWQKLTVTH
jgi:hypothetical protein